MKRSVALASSAGLFVIGVLVGILGMHLYYANLLKRPGPPGAFRARHLTHMLERELDLTAGQMGRIDDILHERRAGGEALRLELAPRVKEHIEGTNALIREVLTEEQQARFEELQQRHPRGWDHFMMGHGVRPPPPRRGPRRPPFRER